MVGGIDTEVELYSPEGKCQHNLSPIPLYGYLTIYDPVMYLLNDQTLACGGSSSLSCFIYNISSDSWSLMVSTSTTNHGQFPGSIYQGKIYLTDDVYPEVFDPVSQKWSFWPLSPISSVKYGCMVT